MRLKVEKNNERFIQLVNKIVTTLTQKEKNDMEFVLSQNENSHQEIELGSLVETEKHLFFLGVALPVIKGNAKEIYCISPEAPIYKNLLNKKIGDSVQVGNSTFEIISIS